VAVEAVSSNDVWAVNLYSYLYSYLYRSTSNSYPHTAYRDFCAPECHARTTGRHRYYPGCHRHRHRHGMPSRS
jgi:hypothetical protein